MDDGKKDISFHVSWLWRLLCDNNKEGFTPFKGIEVENNNDFDLILVDNILIKQWNIPYSFPINKLFSCGHTNKIKLHYLYLHTSKFSQFVNHSFSISSNWINIDSIR